MGKHSKSGNSPKRHHFIPQFILRNFTDKEGKLHCFDKERGGFFSTSPANVFLGKNLYTKDEDGKKLTHVENGLSQIEGAFSEKIKQIIEAARSERYLELKPADEDLLRRFIDIQLGRHPYNQEILKRGLRDPERLEPHIERALGRPLSEEEQKILYNAQENDSAQTIFLDQVNVSDDDPSSWMPALRERRIGICKVAQNAGEFVIGDKQIVIIPSKTGDKNLRNPDVRLLYPISYDVGILWGLMDWERKLMIFDDPRWAEDINKETFRSTDRIVAGRSEHQIQSLLGLAACG